MNIATLDLIIIAVYSVGITATGSAMFASNISTIYLVGLAAAGSGFGLVLSARSRAVCAAVRALFLPSLTFIKK
jgi:hypothetical protein